MLVFTDFQAGANALQVFHSLSCQGQKGWRNNMDALRAECICFRNTSSLSSSPSFFTPYLVQTTEKCLFNYI